MRAYRRSPHSSGDVIPHRMLAIHPERDPQPGSPSHLAGRITHREIAYVNVNALRFSIHLDIMQVVTGRLGAAIVRQFHAADDIRAEDKTPCAACA